MPVAQSSHPFFCHVANCRKSAWGTPNWMTEADWETLKKLRAAASAADFVATVYATPATAEGFFFRSVGWPEGLTYMRDADYAASTGWPGLTHPAHGLLTQALATLAP